MVTRCPPILVAAPAAVNQAGAGTRAFDRICHGLATRATGRGRTSLSTTVPSFHRCDQPQDGRNTPVLGDRLQCRFPAMALSRAGNGVRLGVWFKGRFTKWPADETIAVRMLFLTVGAESGRTRFHNLLNSNDLGNGVTVARLTLDQLVGVQIPIPQFS